MKTFVNILKVILAILCALAAILILILAAPSIASWFDADDLDLSLSGGEKMMLDVDPICQFPDYPTGCESVSLTMLLRYYGTEVYTDQIIDQLPMGSMPYVEDGEWYGGDPEKEFIGSPYEKDGYGIYNEPICMVANNFREGAMTRTGASLKTINRLLESGNPVMAWYTSHPDTGFTYKISWKTIEDHNKVKWPSGEHAVVICGQDIFHYYYADPNDGDIKKVSKLSFRKYFRKIGGRIVYYEY